MTKKFSLESLINLAQHQNDSATRKLGQLNRQHNSAQSKLELLQEYRKDYQSRMQAMIKNGINPVELRNFQGFIDKLDEAIGQQLKLVKQSQVSAQAGRGEFNTAQRKLKSFETLKQRHVEAQRIVSVRSEQASLDEITSTTASYKRFNNEEQS